MPSQTCNSTMVSNFSNRHELDAERALDKPAKTEQTNRRRESHLGAHAVLPARNQQRERKQRADNRKLSDLDADIETEQRTHESGCRHAGFTQSIGEAE